MNEGNCGYTIIKLIFQVGPQLVDHPDRCASPCPSPYSPIPSNLSPPINNKENDENINWSCMVDSKHGLSARLHILQTIAEKLAKLTITLILYISLLLKKTRFDRCMTETFSSRVFRWMPSLLKCIPKHVRSSPSLALSHFSFIINF